MADQPEGKRTAEAAEHFGRRVDERMRALRMNKAHLARLMGTDSGSVGEIVSGHRRKGIKPPTVLTRDTKDVLALALGVDKTEIERVYLGDLDDWISPVRVWYDLAGNPAPSPFEEPKLAPPSDDLTEIVEALVERVDALERKVEERLRQPDSEPPAATPAPRSGGRARR